MTKGRDNEISFDESPTDDVTGWQVAYRGIQLALNNQVRGWNS